MAGKSFESLPLDQKRNLNAYTNEDLADNTSKLLMNSRQSINQSAPILNSSISIRNQSGST